MFDKCPCNIKDCDKKYWKYYVLCEDLIIECTGTRYHVSNWSDDIIYGPYPTSS